jgi:hypothetical protein
MMYGQRGNIEFVAVDKDGKRYRIIEYLDASSSGERGAIDQRGQGSRMLRTESGDDVRWLQRGVYDIRNVFGNIRVTSDDPNAP